MAYPSTVNAEGFHPHIPVMADGSRKVPVSTLYKRVVPVLTTHPELKPQN